MEQYIKWLEENPDLIIRKCNKNSATFKEVEADVVIDRCIIAPSEALEIAEIFEENLNLLAILELQKVDLPTEVKTELYNSAKESLDSVISLANAELNNNGNLALFINAVVNKVPVTLGMLNFNKNMIRFNNSYAFDSSEGVEKGIV